MKKFLLASLLLMGLIMVGCSDSDEGGASSGQLIGTWDCYLETYTDEEGYTEEYSLEEGEMYVVFTRDELIVYDEEDLMNGRAVEYELKGDKLYVAGVEWCDIERLTERDMVWRFEWNDEWYGEEIQRSYFRKR